MMVFKRSKVPSEKKVLAAILCSSGYSYRETAKLLGDMSYVAVHNAYQVLSNNLPIPDKKRRLVSIDENQTKLNTQTIVLWLARDAVTGEVLSFRCSMSGSPKDRQAFIDSVLAFCSQRPLLQVGRGPNYPKVLKNLDLYFQIETTPNASIRERIGRFFLGT
jgi:putative transposase